MTDPAVNKGMDALGSNLDSAKLQDVFKEAGVAANPPAGDQNK
jgi:hypothetical protein